MLGSSAVLVPASRRRDSGLRAWLLADAVAFRDQCAGLGPDAERELSKPVDLLSSGQPYRLRAWELPDDHSARLMGPHRCFVLTEGDELIEIDPTIQEA